MKRAVMTIFVCGLVLCAMACDSTDPSAPPTSVEEVTTDVTKTTTTSIVTPFDPALLGKWQSVEARPKEESIYLGTVIEFGISQSDPGHVVGRMRSGVSDSGDWLFENKFTAQDGNMTIMIPPPTRGVTRGIDRLTALEATYSIEGDVLTIVPSSQTTLSSVTYRRVDE